MLLPVDESSSAQAALDDLGSSAFPSTNPYCIDQIRAVLTPIQAKHFVLNKATNLSSVSCLNELEEFIDVFGRQNVVG